MPRVCGSKQQCLSNLMSRLTQDQRDGGMYGSERTSIVVDALDCISNWQVNDIYFSGCREDEYQGAYLDFIQERLHAACLRDMADTIEEVQEKNRPRQWESGYVSPFICDKCHFAKKADEPQTCDEVGSIEDCEGCVAATGRPPCLTNGSGGLECGTEKMTTCSKPCPSPLENCSEYSGGE